MPNVDPPWNKPQDTQYCKNCEELARKLTAAEQRLAVAETTMDSKLRHTIGLLASALYAGEKWSAECQTASNEAMSAIEAFLSNTDSGWVGVRREDLEFVVEDAEIGWDLDSNNAQKVLDRLRSALTPGGKKDA